MVNAFERVVDAVDIETFLQCADEAEAKELALRLAVAMGLPHPDVVFVEHRGLGARVRIRAYIHRPGSHYQWLDKKENA